jgi:hypothetical protein
MDLIAAVGGIVFKKETLLGIIILRIIFQFGIIKYAVYAEGLASLSDATHKLFKWS